MAVLAVARAGHFELRTAILARCGFDLDLFGKGHAVALQPHRRQAGFIENPHPGLRIGHPAEIENGHGQAQDDVAEMMFAGPGTVLPDGKAGAGDEADARAQQRFQQVGDGVHRIGMITVENKEKDILVVS